MKSSRLTRAELVPLSRAWARSQAEVVVLASTLPGKSREAIEKISALNGKVIRQIEEIDYVRAVLPLGKVEELRHCKEVDEVVLDGHFSLDWDMEPGPSTMQELQRKIGDLDKAEAPQEKSPILSSDDAGAQNPYVPTRDMGIPQFISANPTFDGRGVTIGIVEGPIDLHHEVFANAREMDGSPARKVVGIYSSRDPGEMNHFTVNMEKEVVAKDGSFEHMGSAYQAPASGTYRFGTYGPEQDQLNILWDEAQGLAWMDRNRDNDFSGEMPIGDYNETFDTILVPLGKREIPVAITLHPLEHMLCIFIPSDHTTGVAGAAAGSGFFGGDANGAAPAAKLALVQLTGTTKHHLLEAFALAASLPEVDLVCCSTVAGSFTEAGETFLSRMLNCVADKYDKLILIIAGNAGPGLRTTQEISNADRIISVGGYSHRETLEAVHGPIKTLDDWVNPMSARGPAANGGLKPDIIAPILTAVACTPPAAPSERRRSQPYLRSFSLPTNYKMSQGTSFACPYAAGAVAVLISAAKQSSVSFDAAKLRWALRAGAQFLPDWAAHDQGAGLLQVQGSWDHLRSGFSPPTMQSFAPVRHRSDHELRNRGFGMGLYEREGWVVGCEDERMIILRKTNNSPGPSRYRLKWLGNDGTFEAEDLVEFPEAQKELALRVKVHPRSPGVHSAILNLVDPETEHLIHQVMATIVASESLSPDNSYTIVRQGLLQPMEFYSVFVDIPEGAMALRIALEVRRGQLTVRTNDPQGQEGTQSFLANPSLGKLPAVGRPEGAWSRMVSRPTAGVWEIRIEQERFAQTADAEFQITISALGANVQVSPGIERVNFTNQFAPLPECLAAVEPCRVLRHNLIVSARSPASIDIEVQPNSTRLDLSLQDFDDPQAEVALALYRENEKVFYLWDIATHRGEPEIRVTHPNPGKWRATMHLVSARARTVALSCLEVHANPSYGLVEVGIDSARRSVGETWHTEILKNEFEQSSSKSETAMLVTLIDAERGGTVNSLWETFSDEDLPDLPTEFGSAVTLVKPT